ncbi:peptidoglycan-binding protein [Streptomyces sp. NPDC046862]|uniref:peptidoglycan-binding protein n=1 Tax=Streptomyces sp. NPDC046862 TaxID=3154603 RepID=UPI003452B941
MARMSGATWRPVPNRTLNGQSEVRGVVVHIMAGTLAGTDAWFRNPAAQASSHFGTGRSGALYQWVSTSDRAWAQSAGNRSWLSVENEGKGGDKLTESQLDRNAQVLAWAHEQYDVPLKLASGPSDRGLGYHAMGGSAWGGHTQCPGSKIVAQLPEIVKRAKALVGEPTASDGASTSGTSTYTVKQGDTLSAIAKAHATTVAKLVSLNTLKDPDGLAVGQKLKLPAKKPAAPLYEPFPGAAFFHGGRTSPIITAMGRRLVQEGCAVYQNGPGPNWTNADKESYRRWQKRLGYTGDAADGIPGPSSWAKLRVPNV